MQVASLISAAERILINSHELVFDEPTPIASASVQKPRWPPMPQSSYLPRAAELSLKASMQESTHLRNTGAAAIYAERRWHYDAAAYD